MQFNNLRNVISILKYPLITDKATRLVELNKYTFMIDRKANKFTIKTVIEYLFNVTVLNVNTLNQPKKKKQLVVFQDIKHAIKKRL